MESGTQSNSLLSTNKTSNPQYQVQLHPLVILTISDYVTRHVLRKLQGPIVGAILGAQHGREITMEVAYECKLQEGDGDPVTLDTVWFDKRLQHFKEVHKSPTLDLVGWFTIGTTAGPSPQLLAIHQHLLDVYNDAALLLLFHPSSIKNETLKGGKLPFSIYETTHEASTEDGQDRHMQNGGHEDAPSLSLRFLEVPYSIETGEAEMIGVDSVAGGGANAAASPDVEAATTTATTTTTTAPQDHTDLPSSVPSTTEGKGQLHFKSQTTLSDDLGASAVLSPEDELQIQSLTAKANAINMLAQRIALMKSYLQSLPPSYLSTSSPSHNASAAAATATETDRPNPASQPSSTLQETHPISIDTEVTLPHPALRQIYSLLSRLPLLNSTPGRDAESQTQASDVALTSLLSNLGATVSATQRLGKTAHAFESGRTTSELKMRGMGRGGGGGGAGGGGRGGMGSANTGPVDWDDPDSMAHIMTAFGGGQGAAAAARGDGFGVGRGDMVERSRTPGGDDYNDDEDGDGGDERWMDVDDDEND